MVSDKIPRDEQLTQEIGWLVKEKYKGRIAGKNKDKVEEDVERLIAGEPIDYVIGFSDFAGCKIDLSLRPLIPRAETEYWVEKAIDDILQVQIDAEPKRCLDMFAGSGCIGTALLSHIPFITVDFAEKEKKLLKQIKLNTYHNKIDPHRYRIIQSDIFSGIPDSYDYILANPPYIAESRKKEVQESVLEWEPQGAVFAGKDGLSAIDKFLKGARSQLNRGGKIYMEFDSHQKSHIERILDDCGYKNSEFFNDQFGKSRYLTAESYTQ
ncbi:MAG: HemK family protein methyltransferase [Parcubacteria group bacterium]|nr:HemK family protein methyltransferase [Parcubacteria group bacterium]